MKDKSISILSDIVVFSKYAKYIDELNRRETWEECVERCKNMHKKKYPKIGSVIDEIFKGVKEKKYLPAMRSLQFAGRPIEISPNRMFNCAFAHVNCLEIFSEAMFLLLGGSGLGYSVQEHHVSQVQPIVVKKENLKSFLANPRRFLIEDSIEGWADSIKVLFESFFVDGKKSIIFDYSNIREKGARLITSGGKAPGPEPLKVCLNKLESILKEKVLQEDYKLASIEAHDIICHIADAVLSGGIRRAALICLFSKHDEQMLKCKSPKKFKVFDISGDDYLIQTEDNRIYKLKGYAVLNQNGSLKNEVEFYYTEPQRSRANNSVILLRNSTSSEEWFKLWKEVEKSGCGEPGVYWTNSLETGTNPCVEIGLNDCQFCNLTEVNGGDVDSQEELNNRVTFATILGTLQAGYTDFHYLRDKWRVTTEKEALLGVSITGIGSGCLENLDLTQAARSAKAVNGGLAYTIGINPAARITAVKPAGTTSLVLGSSSGIHAWHNDFYIRRMRLGKDEAIYKYLKKKVPKLIEDDLMNPKGAVLSIPQKAPENAYYRTESPLKLLERVKRFNIEWVREGHNSGETINNVSCTISLKEDEWDVVGKWMWDNKEYYNGISVLPYDGGSYLQAPFEDITKEKFEELYQYLTDIDLKECIEYEDETSHTEGAMACSGGACEIF